MAARSHVLIRSAAIAAALALLGADRAMAGPPFATDDPEPVAYQHFEFYTLTTGSAVRGDTSGIGPAWEFNYGLIPNGQIHIIAPMAFDAPAGGPSQFGYGDTEIGFKYRFIDEDKNGTQPMVGVYPLVELPTGNANLGLGAGNLRAYFPVWIQKSFGDWTTYGGGGYWVNQTVSDRRRALPPNCDGHVRRQRHRQGHDRLQHRRNLRFRRTSPSARLDRRRTAECVADQSVLLVPRLSDHRTAGRS
jgi:hypothetical protein